MTEKIKLDILYSVIIPAYNRAGFILTAVNSVLCQSLRDFELIVIDDGSTDETAGLIEGLDDDRLRYIRQEHSGVSISRNRGLKESRGTFIAFLDSDDRWVPEKLETVDKAVRAHPEYNIFHTREKWFRHGRHLNHKEIHKKQNGHIFETCLKLCSVSISTAVINRKIFNEIGDFDETLPVCEDYDFWLRVTSRYPVYLVDKVLTLKEGGHCDQLSGRYWGMDRFRIKAISKLIDSGTLDDSKHLTAFRELEHKCMVYAAGCYKRGKDDEGDMYTQLVEQYRAGVPLTEDLSQ
ncbi:MAG: glycosyltransferase family A protein [Elusimicrobiota bacterium]